LDGVAQVRIEINKSRRTHHLIGEAEISSEGDVYRLSICRG
jgi:hypothetical protein